MTEPPPIGAKLWLEEVKPRIDKGLTATEIATELGVEPIHVENLIREWTTPYATQDGPALFRDVWDTIERHYLMSESWHYAIASLYVLEAQIAEILPSLFYIFTPGAKGTGKTDIQILIAKLTDGLIFENVSVPALARMLRSGGSVCFDEYDIDRGKELNEVRDALVRQGYKADGAPYVRWDVHKKEPETVPVFGPKWIAFRGGVDAALQDRGFTIPAVGPKGEEGYEYVLANLWKKTEDLPQRLKAWGRIAKVAFPSDRLEEIARSPAFREKMRAAVLELGANRESEIGTIALLVAEIAGIDIISEVRAANDFRGAASGAAESGAVEEVRDIILDLTKAPQIAEGPERVLVQKAVRDELNRRRKERGERPISDRSFARVRQEAGVPETMLRNYGGKMVWRLPERYLRSLIPMANMPNMANIVSLGSDVGHVGHVGLGDERDADGTVSALESTLPPGKRRTLDRAIRDEKGPS